MLVAVSSSGSEGVFQVARCGFVCSNRRGQTADIHFPEMSLEDL